MPEFITLADGSLAVKGRNLVRNAQTAELSATDADYLQTAHLPLSLNATAFRGQQVTIADSAKVSKPKLEFGTEATPFSYAPEDEEVN